MDLTKTIPKLQIPQYHHLLENWPKEVITMRVYLRSYRIPTVLIIMGAIMCIGATLSVAIRYHEYLFYEGLFCLALGILGWLVPSFVRTVKSGSKTRKTPSPAKPPTMTQRRL